MKNSKRLKTLLTLFTIILFIFSCNTKENKDVIISFKPVESETQTESPEVLNRLNALKEIDAVEQSELQKLKVIIPSGSSLYKTYLKRRAEGKIGDNISFDIWLSKVKNDDFAIELLHKYSYKSNLTKIPNANTWFNEEYNKYYKLKINQSQETINKASEQRKTLLLPLQPNIN